MGQGNVSLTGAVPAYFTAEFKQMSAEVLWLSGQSCQGRPVYDTLEPPMLYTLFEARLAHPRTVHFEISGFGGPHLR